MMGEYLQPISMRLDPELWQKARLKALQRRQTMREVIESFLRDWVKDSPKKGAKS